ncbi:nucleotide disphospho-sugar-binding domain-containing protein [Actinokineospora fastidiosa]|uniref:UDP-glucosyltransferase YjiC n=1 Tax=Actinokineospora fastidiosa TaxID=1816 RepID=A0A918GU33_9PSEU|nr:nucleotide disphospho-sugar-binding domain-containing protein [Actinokineospora fastidiosa]GGS59960.1 putative UDP-glucosyltransferase YjiC [Actinokineospora fastidiosa]
MTGKHVLYASIPAWGHVYPVLEGLTELVRRGHRVSASASGSFAPEVGKAVDVVRYDSPMDTAHVELSDMGNVLPLMLKETRAAYAALERVVREDPPDVIVADVLSTAGWLIGQATGIPVVRTWPVFASNSEFSLHQDYGSRSDTDESMAVFFAAVADFLDEVGLSSSVSPQRFFDNEADRNIVLFPREIQPRGETFDERFTFITPCIRPAEDSPEVGWLAAARPLAVVSLGTVFNEKIGFFRTCVEGVERLGWHTAAALGDKVPPERIGPVSDRVLLRARLPMIDALRHASVAVSHGGLTSTVEALAHGVPVLVAPQIGEQRGVADSIERLGLGVRLPEPFTAAELADVIKEVVNDTAMADRLALFRRKLRGGRSGGEFADAVEAAFV